MWLTNSGSSHFPPVVVANAAGENFCDLLFSSCQDQYLGGNGTNGAGAVEASGSKATKHRLARASSAPENADGLLCVHPEEEQEGHRHKGRQSPIPWAKEKLKNGKLMSLFARGPKGKLEGESPAPAPLS